MDFELAQVSQLEWSADLRVLSAEGACQRVLGHPESELVGSPLQKVLRTTAERAGELDGAARGAAPSPVFLPFQRGSERTVLRLALGQADGRARAAVVDIGALLAGAPPVQISRLSSSLSHEIRNPLSSVKMAVQTLARNPGHSEKDKRRLVIANREIRTMERMLWLLSEYGRDAPANLEPVSLRNLTLEAAALVEQELQERKIQVEIQEDPAAPRVRADATRVRPVLAQLLLNIAMGLEAGASVQAAVKPGPKESATLVLEDPSTALPADERARLFEPFASMLARGAGLSLAALNRVMLAQGGSVTADGGAAKGTVYTLYFPSLHAP